MSLLYYSNSAERKVAVYLDMLATKELGGAYLPEDFNRIAHQLVRQIMLDNDEITCYSATKAEIKAEAAL